MSIVAAYRGWNGVGLSLPGCESLSELPHLGRCLVEDLLIAPSKREWLGMLIAAGWGRC